ncbi:MAG: hypothetical protein ACOYXU_09275 [Nitrospirota bacterium]
MNRVAVATIAPLIAVSVLMGCAATKMTSMWKDEAYKKQPRKVLAVAILKSNTNRLVLEDEFTAQLKQRGLDATAGHTVLSDKEPVNKETVAAALRDKGFDTLLLVRLVDQRSQQTYVPGAAYPVGATWPGYYGVGYNTMYTPGYVVEDKFAIAETNMYDVETEKLIWTAATETWIKSSERKLIDEYVGLMMHELEKSGIVK